MDRLLKGTIVALMCLLLIIMIIGIFERSHYECVMYDSTEIVCKTVQVCKVPGEGGQCWFYTTERECEQKKICLEWREIENE